MSSIVFKLVKGVRNNRLRKLMLKPLFRKNNLRLHYFRSYNDKFFIYGVNGKFFPSEVLNWYQHYGMVEAKCDDICMFDYKVRKGDTIVDIGAGLGEEALVLADRVGKEGKVYSIEANPVVFRILEEVIRLNGFRNTELLNLGINFEDAPIHISDNDESYMTGFVENKNKATTATVEGLRFDSFVKKFGIKRIDLLKCNIEGAERFVVDTIGTEVLPMIRNVAIACHDFRYPENQNEFFVTKQYIINYLRENSFEVITRNSGADYKDDWVYGRNRRANN